MNSEELAKLFLEKMKMQRKSFIRFNSIYDNFVEGESGILAYLSFEEDGVTSGTLCEKLNLSSPRVANILNTLEKKGCISKINDSSDRRKVIVMINNDIKEKMFEIRDKIINHFVKIIDELGEEEFKEFERLTLKINEININLLNKE